MLWSIFWQFLKSHLGQLEEIFREAIVTLEVVQLRLSLGVWVDIFLLSFSRLGWLCDADIAVSTHPPRALRALHELDIEVWVAVGLLVALRRERLPFLTN